MKRLLAALTLTCALSVSALAGDIPTCGIASPGDIPSTDSPVSGDIQAGSEAPGEIPTGGLAALLTILSLAF